MGDLIAALAPVVDIPVGEIIRDGMPYMGVVGSDRRMRWSAFCGECWRCGSASMSAEMLQTVTDEEICFVLGSAPDSSISLPVSDHPSHSSPVHWYEYQKSECVSATT